MRIDASASQPSKTLSAAEVRCAATQTTGAEPGAESFQRHQSSMGATGHAPAISNQKCSVRTQSN